MAIFKHRLGASRSRSVCLPNKFPNEISKQNFQTKFPNKVSKTNFQTEFSNQSSKSSFQTEQKLLLIFRGRLQTVIPLLIRGVASILQIFSILSGPSMIEFFKTLRQRPEIQLDYAISVMLFSLLFA